MKLKSIFRISTIILALTMCIALLAACSDDEDKPAEQKQSITTPTNITAFGNVITWDEVANASNYQATVTLPDNTVIVNNSITEPRFVLRTFTDGEYKFKVKAISASSSYNDSAISQEITVTKVGVPTNVGFANGGASSILTWTAVEGAIDYTVRIGTNEFIAKTNQFDLKNSFLSSYPSISVRANDGANVVASAYSSDISANIAGAVALSVNDSTQLEWNLTDSTSVAKMTITIDGNPVMIAGSIVENLLTIDSRTLDLKHLLPIIGDHEIVVSLLSNNPAAYKEVSQKLIARVVAAPTISVENGRLKLSNVDAKASNINLSCIASGSNGTSTTISVGNSEYLDVEQLSAGSYSITAAINPNQIKEGNVCFIGSAPSAALDDVVKLAAPTVTMQSGEVTLSSVANALYYTYKVDNGTESKLRTDGSSLKISLDSENLTEGTHSFYVKSMASSGKYLNSNYSSGTTCVALAPLELSIANKVLTWQNTQAASYRISTDSEGNRVINPDTNGMGGYSFDLSTLDFTVGAHTIYLRTIYDSANQIPQVSSIDIIVYKAPQIVTANGYIEAEGDRIGLTITNVNNGVSTNIELVSYEMAQGYFLDGFEAGTYTVSARVLGDESTSFSSEFSTPKRVTKLPSPTQLSLSGQNTLSWASVIDATGYVVEVRNARTTTSTNSLSVAEISGYTKNELKVAARHVGGEYINSEWAYFDETSNDGFWGGAGTEKDPYIISTIEHLNNIRNFPNANFVLVNNIKYTGEWIPIEGFTGTFDGAGYMISDIAIAAKTGGSIGLFANASNAVIKNLKLNNAQIVINIETNVENDNYIGLLVGSANNTTITNCIVNGKITAYNIYSSSGNGIRIGGIVGNLSHGALTNCTVDTNIQYSFDLQNSDNKVSIGGAIGVASGTAVVISNLFVSGDVSAVLSGGETDLSIAGAIGRIMSAGLKVDTAISSGTVYARGLTSQIYAAGFVANSLGSLTRCGTISDVNIEDSTSDQGTYIGGFAAMSTGLIQECFASGAVRAEILKKELSNRTTFYIAGFIASHTSTIKSSYSTSDVQVVYMAEVVSQADLTGIKYVGGFLAESKQTKIEHSYYSGRISVTTDIATNLQVGSDKGSTIYISAFCTDIQLANDEDVVFSFYTELNDYSSVQFGNNVDYMLTAEQFKNISVFKFAGWEISNTLSEEGVIWYVDGNHSPVHKWSVGLI